MTTDSSKEATSPIPSKRLSPLIIVLLVAIGCAPFLLAALLFGAIWWLSSSYTGMLNDAMKIESTNEVEGKEAVPVEESR
jgi:hypothetical protein